MKKARKTTIFFMILLFVFSLLPQGLAASSLPNTVYIASQVPNGCTIASAAMVMRSCAYYSGYNDWAQITDVAIKSVAWLSNVGLAGSFTYKFAGNSITMKSQSVNSGFTIESLKQLLKQHPEGIALYCTSMPHAVFLTDYDGDIFYCADPYGNPYSGKRIPLTSSRLGYFYGSQANILSNAKKYWYISSYSITPTVPDTEAPTITKAQIGDAGPSGFYVKCSATDNIYLKNLRIGVWHSAMHVDNAVWYSLPARNNEEVEFWVNYSDFPNHHAGNTYYVNAYAYDYGGNSSDSVRAGELLYEIIPPIITSAEIKNVTPMGYDVVCTATDNSRLSYIFTGTWHDDMNIDDAVWQKAYPDGDKVVIHINTADFSYAQDVTYHTNVYARDAAGNISEAFSAGSIYIKKDLSAVVGLRNISPSGFDIVCYAVGIPDCKKITIGTWHDQMHVDNAQWQVVNGSSAVFRINTRDFGNAVNVTYHTNLYFTDSSGRTRDAIRAADIMIENKPATITGSKVENVTSDGFDVSVSASDNSILSKIKIATWNSEMSIDNAIWQEVNVYPNRKSTASVSFHIDIEDFGFARDATYWTNAYAFDECGNASDVKMVGSVEIPYPASEKPDFILPSDLTTIEDEAFSGIRINAVLIPKTVVNIIGDPFKNSQISYIFGYADSAAEEYAENYGYNFREIDDEWMKDN